MFFWLHCVTREIRLTGSNTKIGSLSVISTNLWLSQVSPPVNVSLYTASCSQWPKGLQQHGVKVYDCKFVRERKILSCILNDTCFREEWLRKAWDTFWWRTHKYIISYQKLSSLMVLNSCPHLTKDYCLFVIKSYQNSPIHILTFWLALYGTYLLWASSSSLWSSLWVLEAFMGFDWPAEPSALTPLSDREIMSKTHQNSTEYLNR